MWEEENTFVNKDLFVCVMVNSVQSVFLRVFMDEINIWVIRVSKADCSLGRMFCPPYDQPEVWIKWKCQPSPMTKGISSAWLFELGSQLLPVFGFELNHLFFLVSNLLAFRLELHHYLSWSPTSQLLILGILNLHKLRNQFLIINISIDR